MAEQALALDYARAYFEKAVEKHSRDLHALNNAVTRGNVLTRLDNPAETLENKKALLNGLLPPNAETAVSNLAYLLANRNQMHLLNQVVRDFDSMVAQGAPGVVAVVTTTIDLTAEDKSKLEAKLRNQFGQDLRFDYQLDPSILGGVIVRVGDVVVDGSIAAKLSAMKQKLETAR